MRLMPLKLSALSPTAGSLQPVAGSSNPTQNCTSMFRNRGVKLLRTGTGLSAAAGKDREDLSDHLRDLCPLSPLLRQMAEH